MTEPRSKAQLLAENKKLKAQLAESEATIRAIRKGDIDALIVSAPEGEKVFTLVGADSVYRLLVETMSEAAFLVAFDGTILFCNARFGQFLKKSIQQITGHRLGEFIAADHLPVATQLLSTGCRETLKARLIFTASDGSSVPAHVSSSPLRQGESVNICVVATDLSELEKSSEMVQRLKSQQEELRNATEDAERHAAKLDAVISSLPDGFVIYNEREEMIFVNDAAKEILELTLGDTGVPLEKWVVKQKENASDQYHPVEMTPVRRALKGEIVRDYIAVSDTPGGPFYTFITCAPIRSSDGKITGAVGTFRNITERQRMEDALDKINKKYATMFDYVSDGVWLIDLDGRIVEINDSYCRMSGYSRNELIGMHISRLEGVESTPDVEAHIRKIMETGQDRFESKHRRKDGSVIDVEISTLYMTLEGGRIAMLARDITERKKLEAALKRRSEELNTIFEASPSTIFFKDRENRFLRVNEAFSRVLGVPKDQIVGHSVSEFYSKEQTEAFLKQDLEVINSGQPKLDVVQQLKTPTGDRSFRIDKIPFRDEQGNVVGVIGFALDITERRRRGERLQKLNRTLRALSNSSRAMMRATDETRYLAEICQIIVEDCGYEKVWIGLAENDKEKSIRPVVQMGLGKDYIEALDLSWGDHEQGPTGKAIRSGKPEIYTHILSDARFAFWRKKAEQLGYASLVALPLLEGKTTLGAITIYSSNEDPFSGDEVSLLSELAADVAYGVAALRLRLERRQSEEKIKSLARFPAENPNPVMRALFDGTISYANDPAKIFLKGLPSLPGRLSEELLALVQASASQNNKITAETDSDGRTYSLTVVPFTDSGYANIIGQDITLRKQAEEALRRSEELFRLTVNNMPEALAILDADGRVKFVNSNVHKLLGLSGDPTGKRPEELLVPDLAQKLLPAIRNVYETRKAETEECTLDLPGGCRTFIMRYEPLLKDGRVDLLICFTYDITDRKQYEETIEKSLREKETLLREIHHRVKNNFQIISSLLNLQSSNIKDERVIGMFQAMQNRLKSMSMAHEKLYRSTDLSSINMGDYLESLVESFRKSYEAGASVRIRVEAEPVFLSIDHALPCALVAGELVVNALKHGFPAGRCGEIFVGLKGLGASEATLTVKDTGIGLPENFNPETTDSLGLSLVTALTGQLHAKIALARQGGTTWSITFPVKSEAAHAPLTAKT